MDEPYNFNLFENITNDGTKSPPTSLDVLYKFTNHLRTIIDSMNYGHFVHSNIPLVLGHKISVYGFELSNQYMLDICGSPEARHECEQVIGDWGFVVNWKGLEPATCGNTLSHMYVKLDTDTKHNDTFPTCMATNDTMVKQPERKFNLQVVVNITEKTVTFVRIWWRWSIFG